MELGLFKRYGRRLGRFVFTKRLLEEPNLNRIKKVMAKVVILRAEYDPSYDGFAYIAFSEEFDEIEFGAMIPEYQIEWVDSKPRLVVIK